MCEKVMIVLVTVDALVITLPKRRLQSGTQRIHRHRPAISDLYHLKTLLTTGETVGRRDDLPIVGVTSFPATLAATDAFQT